MRSLRPFMLTLFALLLLVGGCFNPSFDGPGGYLCKGGDCPPGQECCPGRGAAFCVKVGMCVKDLGPGKDGPGKDGKTTADKKIPADQRKPGPLTCPYNDVVASSYAGGPQQFALTMNKSGDPQVFFIATGSLEVRHATRAKGLWSDTRVGKATATRVAAVGNNTTGALHVVIRQQPAISGSPTLELFSKTASSAQWQAARVDDLDIGEALDIATNGSLTYITATNDGAKKYWKVYKMSGGGAPNKPGEWFKKDLGKPFRHGRIAVGKLRQAALASVNNNWELWSTKHIVAKDEKSISVSGGSSPQPADIAMDNQDRVWIAQVKADATGLGKLTIATWTPGIVGMSVQELVKQPRVVPSSVSVTIDSVSSLYVAWMEKSAAGHTLKLARRAGPSWSNHQSVTTSSLKPYSQVAMDEAGGFVHVTYGTAKGQLMHACQQLKN